MQVTKKENLTVVIRTYKDQQGQDKNVYKTIGEITTFQGNEGEIFQSAELYFMPGAKINVFEQKKKENGQQNNNQQQNQQQNNNYSQPAHNNNYSQPAPAQDASNIPF